MANLPVNCLPRDPKSTILADAAELFVSLPRKKGRFGLTFRDAFVLGQQGSIEANRKRFEEAWLGTRTGGRWSPLVPPKREADSYYA